VPSKKRFVAKPPEETIFFIDRSLGTEPISTTLKEAGLTVCCHDEHFKRDEEDRVWLTVVGERGWVVLTKDQRLRYRPLEIAALRSSRCRVFILTAGNLRGSEIASAFLIALPRMFKVISTSPGPFIARVTKSGMVNLLL
jgi:predicted nuclease of predicted toxin-antitoxin system